MTPNLQDNIDRVLVDSHSAHRGSYDRSADAEALSPWQIVDDRLRGRWRYAIVLGLILGATLSLAGYRLAPVKYEGTGRIHVAPTGHPILRETEETGPLVGYNGAVKTHAILVRTPRVADRALEDPALAGLPLAQSPNARDQILEDLTSKAERGAELITVSFEARSAETAQAVVNAILRSYDEIYGERGSEIRVHRLERLRESRDDLRRQRQVKRQAINDFIATTEYGGSSLGHVLTTKLLRIEQLKQDLEGIELALQSYSVPTDGAAKADKTHRDPSPEELDAFDPELASVRRRWKDSKLQLEQLAHQFYPSHPVYVRAERELPVLEAMLAWREGAARAKWDAAGGITIVGDQQLGVGAPEELRSRKVILHAMLEKNLQEVRRLNNEQAQLAELNAELADTKESLAEIDEIIRILTIESDAVLSGRISIAEWASKPSVPSKDRRKQLAMAGFGGGFGLSFALFLLLGIVDRRAFSAAQLVRNSARYPCLGVLPHLGVSHIDPASAEAAAQCVHRIRNRIKALHDEAGSSMLVVSSPAPGDGKTNIVMALGWSYAASGHRTLLVDCDLVGQSLTRQMGVLEHDGLKEVLRDRRLDGQIASLPVANLSILGVGVDSSFRPEAVRKDDFSALCAELRQQFDVIIVDTGVMPVSVEVLPIAMAADGVILVVRRGGSRSRLEECIRELETVRARCLGVVFNCADRADCERYASRGSGSARTSPQRHQDTSGSPGGAEPDQKPDGGALVRAMESAGRLSR